MKSSSKWQARKRIVVHAEVLDAWKKVENAVVSMSSVGLSVDSDASKEAEGFVTTSQNLICELFPALMEAVCNEDDGVRLAPLQFLQAYANKLKTIKKQRGSLLEVSPLMSSKLIIFKIHDTAFSSKSWHVATL